MLFCAFKYVPTDEKNLFTKFQTFILLGIDSRSKFISFAKIRMAQGYNGRASRKNQIYFASMFYRQIIN